LIYSIMGRMQLACDDQTPLSLRRGTISFLCPERAMFRDFQ
jgi:hypothetical protein